jgi:cyclopropane-fatty-acyl-phospholipid synthase
MTRMAPFYGNVQAHYDLSDDFFALFLDPTRTYSCAYFERADMTLEEAQRAKIDLSLGKCDLHPGLRLLDIGCGWGATMMRAVQHYDVNVVGLTLSRNQYGHAQELLSGIGGPRTAEVRLQGWEEFDEPVDRIVSIGAFEHFRKERYDAFFDRCRNILAPGGRMMLHTIVGVGLRDIKERGLPITRELIKFGRFIGEEIFPGGQLPEPKWVISYAEQAGFTVADVQSLQPHYARTLDCWAEALRSRREEAVAITPEGTYERYMKYLTGCADLFRAGYVDVRQHVLLR